MIARALIALLRGYKRYISPHLGHHCRFVPTCSEYAMQALATHGLLKGLLLTVWRLLRCQPFARFGYDPVPPKGRWVSPDRKLTRSRCKASPLAEKLSAKRTDEGRTSHRRPAKGWPGKPTPHPAFGHLLPREKAFQHCFSCLCTAQQRPT